MTRKHDLTREQWLEAGLKVKLASAAIGEVFMLIQTTLTQVEMSAAFDKVDAGLQRVKCRLDDHVCKQHPGWPEATRVFYGPMQEGRQ